MLALYFEHPFENAFQHYLMDWFQLFKKKRWMKVGYQLLKRNGENSKTAKMSISLKRYSTRRNLGPEDSGFYVRAFKLFQAYLDLYIWKRIYWCYNFFWKSDNRFVGQDNRRNSISDWTKRNHVIIKQLRNIQWWLHNYV